MKIRGFVGLGFFFGGNMAKKKDIAPAPEPADPQKALDLLNPQARKPKPGDVIGKKLVCPKHGDVTSSALSIVFGSSKEEEGKKQYLYCLICLNDVLLTFQKNKAIETLDIQDVVYAESDAHTHPVE